MNRIQQSVATAKNGRKLQHQSMKLQMTKEQWSLERKAQEVFCKSKSRRDGKNGTITIRRYFKNKHFLFYAQGHGSKFEPATPL